jgi:hypothetical protein
MAAAVFFAAFRSNISGVPSLPHTGTLPMEQWEQYEVWSQNGKQWEMLAFFQDFEVASAVARNRSSNMRLVHSVYQDGAMVEQQILAELGTTRSRILK